MKYIFYYSFSSKQETGLERMSNFPIDTQQVTDSGFEPSGPTPDPVLLTAAPHYACRTNGSWSFQFIQDQEGHYFQSSGVNYWNYDTQIDRYTHIYSVYMYISS